jgi:meiotically up-regulated gene 157 (Mug157) protein
MLPRRKFIQAGALLTGGTLFSQSLFAGFIGPAYRSRRPSPGRRRFHSEAVESEISRIKSAITDPELAWLFENCFPNTLDTTVKHYGIIKGRPDAFIITGDIDAMWLRDSSAQVYPYLPYINDDVQLKSLIQGVINRQAKCVLIDPYANAFNYDASKKSGWYSDNTDMKMELHERKWEVDSLCYVIRLAYRYWKVSGGLSSFDTDWVSAMKAILRTFREQQRKVDHGPYHFQRGTDPSDRDSLTNNGYGPAFKPVGMICSMFRPSDDATTYPFLIPSNFFAVVSLRQLSEIFLAMKNDTLSAECLSLAAEVELAIRAYAIYHHPTYGDVYCYEVDGLGGRLVIDEPNLPNLLSLTYFGAVDESDTIYQNTRKMILSEGNPYFVKGKYAEGVGSDHTPKGYVWHLSLIARALTSSDDREIAYCLRVLRDTHAGKGFMHEGFDANDPSHYTRSWFAWADTIFGELIVKVYNERPHLLRAKL